MIWVEDLVEGIFQYKVQCMHWEVHANVCKITSPECAETLLAVDSFDTVKDPLVIVFRFHEGID